MERYYTHSHYMGLAGPALRTAVGVVAGLCFIAFGYGQGDIGGLLNLESFSNFFPAFAVSLHPHSYMVFALSGTVVATWNLGCFLGAILTIFLGDRLGRKRTIVWGLAVESIGKLLQVTAFSQGQYIAGRVIAGVGNGYIASTIPAWQAECLKTHKRGTLLLVSFGTCITFGVALAYWIIYGMSFAQESSASWRFPIAFSLAIILPALVIMIFMPESPRWLLLKGREKEAISVLSALNELPQDSEDIRRELLSIKYAVKHMASAPVGDIKKNGEYRYLHRVLLAIGLQIMQQWTGVNLFIQWMGFMFKNLLHYDFRDSMLLAAVSTTWFFIASSLAVVLIDRFMSRRTLTMTGSAGMCVSMVFLCGFNWAGDHGSPWAFKAMTAFIFLYCTFFSVGWQGMSWMWSVELIPLNIRGPANAMATAANWISNFTVVITGPPLFSHSKWRTYILYTVTNFLIVPTIYFLYPDTGSRSLEEVDILFKAANEKSNPWLQIVRVAKEEPRWFDKNGDPTDSYGSSTGKSDYDPEKGSVSDDNIAVRSRSNPSTSPNRVLQLSNEDWENRGAAPAPVMDSQPATFSRLNALCVRESGARDDLSQQENLRLCRCGWSLRQGFG